MHILITCILLFAALGCDVSRSKPPAVLEPAAIDAEVERLMERESVNGLAVAVIEGGQVSRVTTYGYRNAEKRLPLTPTTIMYAASLTRPAFAHMVLQLVDEGRLDLDASIAELLPRPLPEYDRYHALDADERWKALTPRILLANTSGLPNFRHQDPWRGVLKIHFTPGTRYAYSGEGYLLLQRVLEEGVGLDIGREMQTRVFDRFGMRNTSMVWRPDFAANCADGYTREGKMRPHDPFTNLSAAGSMDTTIEDQALMWAAILRGEGLSAASRAELVRAQIPITSRHQFPSMSYGYSPRHDEIDLAAGLGLVTFRDASGLAWFKGGHNNWHSAFVIGFESGQRGMVLMANDVRAERIFPEVARLILGPTDMPWSWEYQPQRPTY